MEFEDDEPVLGPARRCADCAKVNVPLVEYNDELVCEDCEESRVAYGRKHCGESEDRDQEVTFEYHVKITVQTKNFSVPQMILARLRALEILLGIPMVSDVEAWEHELITTVDSEGNEIPD